MTLCRIGRDQELEPLGPWARNGYFPNMALTTGVDGTLVLSTWNDGEYAVAVVDVSGAGDWPMRVLSMVAGEGSIHVPAFRNMDGTTLVLQQGNARVPVRITPFMSGGPAPIDVSDGAPDVLEAVF